MDDYYLSGYELKAPPKKIRMHGKFKKGGKKKYLSNKEIEEIKKLYPNYFNWQLAIKFNVHESTILSIKKKYNLQKSEKIMQYTRYKKGVFPWNKDKKGIYSLKNSGQFKKGHISANSKKDGDIIIRKHSRGEKYYYIRIKPGKWKLYHRYLYELKYGKISDGYIVIFKDKNTLNCNIDNLELISQKENMRRNTNRKKATQILRETWKKEKLRVIYGLPQQTKLKIKKLVNEKNK